MNIVLVTILLTISLIRDTIQYDNYDSEQDEEQEEYHNEDYQSSMHSMRRTSNIVWDGEPEHSGHSRRSSKKLKCICEPYEKGTEDSCETFCLDKKTQSENSKGQSGAMVLVPYPIMIPSVSYNSILLRPPGGLNYSTDGTADGSNKNSDDESNKKSTDKPKGKGTDSPKGEGTDTPKGKGKDKPKEKGKDKPKGKGKDKPKEKGTEAPKGKGTEAPKGKGTESPKGSGSDTDDTDNTPDNTDNSDKSGESGSDNVPTDDDKILDSDEQMKLCGENNMKCVKPFETPKSTTSSKLHYSKCPPTDPYCIQQRRGNTQELRRLSFKQKSLEDTYPKYSAYFRDTAISSFPPEILRNRQDWLDKIASETMESDNKFRLSNSFNKINPKLIKEQMQNSEKSWFPKFGIVPIPDDLAFEVLKDYKYGNPSALVTTEFPKIRKIDKSIFEIHQIRANQ